MRWVLWILTGIGLLLAIILGACILGLARLNPWLTKRLAGSALAAGLLMLVCETALLAWQPRRD